MPRSSALSPETTAVFDVLLPFVQRQAVDEMALRLVGLSGERLHTECHRLTEAILTEMEALGHVVGTIEKGVVVTTLWAAVGKALRMTTGRA